MKTLTLIIAIAIILIVSPRVNAQIVVVAKCHTFNLSPAQVNYLHRFADPQINAALQTSRSIKYNSTADIIVSILTSKNAPKWDNKNLIASK